MATSAYEFVRVEKTPTLWSACQHVLLLRAKSAAGLWRGGKAHSLEFSNCARTAMAVVLPWNMSSSKSMKG